MNLHRLSGIKLIISPKLKNKDRCSFCKRYKFKRVKIYQDTSKLRYIISKFLLLLLSFASITKRN